MKKGEKGGISSNPAHVKAVATQKGFGGGVVDGWFGGTAKPQTNSTKPSHDDADV